jgi:FkbM family methyltransferase
MSTLIYDIGLHDGEDSAHYLREGARVVAIDANPVMCAAAEAHFRNYIQTGQLTVINRGLAERSGQLEFWICDDVTEWSSFRRDLASRDGARHHAITVDCVPIVDVISEFGVADYMKIDIEGNDKICIAGLTTATAPPYISIEMDIARADEDIRRLRELGYRGFKVICQNIGWRQVTTNNFWFYRLGPHHPFVRTLKRLRTGIAHRVHGRKVGESGPWGEKTPGPWRSFADACEVWRLIREAHEQITAREQAHYWWFDIHAKK